MSNAMPAQSAANHTRMVPGFHYLGGALVAINVIWSCWMLLRERTAANGIHVLVAFLIIVVFWFSRTFALTVQDRVIRLEERLRLGRLLPSEMHPRIEELTRRQLVALRFASDAELPALTARVLAGEFADNTAIKGAIREWRADHLRA